MFALYRKGNTHIVDGIECEVARVSIDALDTYRSEGWVDNVEDIGKPKPEEVKPEPAKKEQPVKKGMLGKLGKALDSSMGDS